MAKTKPVLTAIADKRERLVQELPNCGWSLSKAAEAVGYSHNYAWHRLPKVIAKDVQFCEKVNQLRAELSATKGNEIENLVQFWDEAIANTKLNARDRLKATELKGKYHGIFSEKRVLEIAPRQRELSASEQDEGRKLALLRFDTMQSGSKQGIKHVQSEVVDTQSPHTPYDLQSNGQVEPALEQAIQPVQNDSAAAESTPTIPPTG